MTRFRLNWTKWRSSHVEKQHKEPIVHWACAGNPSCREHAHYSVSISPSFGLVQYYSLNVQCNPLGIFHSILMALLNGQWSHFGSLLDDNLHHRVKNLLSETLKFELSPSWLTAHLNLKICNAYYAYYACIKKPIQYIQPYAVSWRVHHFFTL